MFRPSGQQSSGFSLPYLFDGRGSKAQQLWFHTSNITDVLTQFEVTLIPQYLSEEMFSKLCLIYLIIKIRFFDVRRVMKPVGGAKIP